MLEDSIRGLPEDLKLVKLVLVPQEGSKLAKLAKLVPVLREGLEPLVRVRAQEREQGRELERELGRGLEPELEPEPVRELEREQVRELVPVPELLEGLKPAELLARLELVVDPQTIRTPG